MQPTLLHYVIAAVDPSVGRDGAMEYGSSGFSFSVLVLFIGRRSGQAIAVTRGGGGGLGEGDRVKHHRGPTKPSAHLIYAHPNGKKRWSLQGMALR
jgi:hypothetical protein